VNVRKKFIQIVANPWGLGAAHKKLILLLLV